MNTPRINVFSIILLLFFSLILSQYAHAQGERPNKSREMPSNISGSISVNNFDLGKSHIDELELPLLTEFQQRVQKRYKQVSKQGFGRALLLQPFSTKYRIVKYRVYDNQAIQGDVVLGNLRQVIKDSISNRDAGIKAGDPASKTVSGEQAPPPLIADATYRWPDGKVPYDINTKDFSTSQITLINNAISALNQATNLTLSVKTDADKDYISIVGDPKIDGTGQSKVGRQGGKQKLSLNTSTTNMFGESTVKHEILHAVGFHHEQTRADRNQYIQILHKNIIDGLDHNFDINETRTFGPYDYASIMHYGKTAFGHECKLSDYADNHQCSDCSITTEKAFLAAKKAGDPCKKITMRSVTATDIKPGNNLTTEDIAAVNAAYPANTLSKNNNSLPPISDYRTFSLTVEKLKRVAGSNGESGAVCGKHPDFIGELLVGHVREIDTGQSKKGILLVNDTSLSKKKKKDKLVGDSVAPNWTLDVPVGPNTKELYLIVKTWEYDDALCGGKNDLVDISPQRDQAYLRLIVNLETGELQHLRPQPATNIGGVVYYERAKYSGHNIFNSRTGSFVSCTFSGLEDNSATEYQMEASITLKGTVI